MILRKIFIFFLLLFTFQSYAQEVPQGDTSDVEIIYSDLLSVQGDTKELKGKLTECHLRQGDADIWFWTGRVLPNRIVTANGDTHIMQPDSTNIFADSIYYDGNEKMADLFGNVTLQDSSVTLYTEQMRYDLDSQIAIYDREILIIQDSTELTAQQGSYKVNSATALFYGDVKVKNPNFTLTADSLEYNTRLKTAFFHGPTHIFQDDKKIYCEAGYYDTRKKYASLRKNASYDSDSQHATADEIIYDGNAKTYTLNGNAFYQDSAKTVTADQIIYNEETKSYTFNGNPVFKDKNSSQKIKAERSAYDEATNTMVFTGDVVVIDSTQTLLADTLRFNRTTHEGKVRGNIVWTDSTAHTTLYAQSANYNDSTGYIKSWFRPLLVTLIDNDTLWLKADTLISFKTNPDDSLRNLMAFHDVRFFKSDMQGLADSLYYSDKDSLFTFYDNPILWADTSQFTADTLALHLKNKKIDYVNQYNNSFIVNSPDSTFYNQIKGKNINAVFKDGNINTMFVKTEGETIYYAQDESGAYSGVNKTICEDMRISFGANKVKQIRFFKQPKAVLYPMGQVDHKTMRLDGFKWLINKRPTSKKSL